MLVKLNVASFHPLVSERNEFSLVNGSFRCLSEQGCKSHHAVKVKMYIFDRFHNLNFTYRYGDYIKIEVDK